MKNKKKLIIVFGIIFSIITIGIIKNKKSVKADLPVQTIKLEKKKITNSISTSGVVVSDEKVNVFTNQSLPIKEVLVSPGDRVKKGDVLAVLDISGLENELAQSKLTYKGSIESLEESEKENKNNIVNSNTSFKASQIALEQQILSTRNAEEDLKKLNFKKKFDDKAYNHSIKESGINLKNKELSLKTGLEEENKLKAKLNTFDDSSVKEEVLEKSKLVQRKKFELVELEKELVLLKKKPMVFEDQGYENSLADARRDYNRKNEEKNRVEKSIEKLNEEYNKINSSSNKSDEELKILKDRIDEEKNKLNGIKSEIAEAEIIVSRVRETLEKAKVEFYRNTSESRSTSIKELEKNIRQNKYELEDLEGDYSKALKKMDKDKREQLKIALSDYEKLKLSNKDLEYELVVARNNYEKSLLEKEKAIENHMEENKKELSLAKRNLLDSRKQLDSSRNSLENSKHLLDQSKHKSLSSTSADINKLSVEKLESQIENGRVIATSDGVVTEVKAEVGAISNEILFVIEDVDNVHIKARIKEHNLSSVNLGQRTDITTVATGDEIFNGKINYISPRAVTQTGSPSVEFEVFAKPDSINEKIKLGMNGFLNIVVESKENVFAVPLNAIVREGKGIFIHTEEDVKIPVELGISTKSDVEIKSSALKEGMEIRTDVNEQPGEGIVYEG